MKKIAGTLRLELAQFRELEAFAKFGSDLDKATQQQLRRGERLVEVLKQKQYSPVPVEQQVIIIYAATKGYLDEIPVKNVKQYESDLLSQMTSMNQDILKEIAEKKEMSAETEEKLKKTLSEFSERFKSSLQ